MHDEIIDTFADLSEWTTFASGEAQLAVYPDHGCRGNAMRMEFDFRGGGGFVVARKSFPLDLPESYLFSFHVRGDAPSNIFEFKLTDETNQNVWRYRIETLDLSETWQPVTIRNSQIEFAWGPLGGGPARRVAAIELVIAAGPGGRGTIWIDELHFQDVTYRLTPAVQASSSLTGYDPQHILTSASSECWRSEPASTPQWLIVDFLQEREFGGLVIHWDPGFQARHFEVLLSMDGIQWERAYATTQADSERNYVYLSQTISRYIRLDLYQSVGNQGFGIVAMDVKPYDFSRSLNHFFQNIAREAPAGLYPKYFLGQQTYWTPVSSGAGTTQALVNEEGMVEVDKGLFSIEPFLLIENHLLTWADVTLTQDLMNGYLPIPSSYWKTSGLIMQITAFAAADQASQVLYLRYVINNTQSRLQSLRLFLAIRPFQVTPTWQNWRSFGGVTDVTELAFNNDMVMVNRSKAVIPFAPPTGFGAAAFAEGDVLAYVAAGRLPPQREVIDDFGHASGALCFDLTLDAGRSQTVYVAVPFGAVDPASACTSTSLLSIPADEQLERATRSWQSQLDTIEIKLPPSVQSVVNTMKTAAAHILVNRDGPALHPGPRRYSRSWIRDGALMGAALLRMGHTDPMRDFITWYAQYQAEDGAIPDCADREGAEWLPEFDAYGEFIFAVMEYYRFSGDREFLMQAWPAVTKTVAYLEHLRSQRLTAEYQKPQKLACYGLLPESMSHEGYMAHPVHAYWDDFWALQGFKDAADMATVLEKHAEATRLETLAQAFSETIRISLAATIERHGIDFVPGSVEFGDFDPTATSVAIGLLDQLHLFPAAETTNTFDTYLTGFRKRASGTIPWNNYSAYEIRIIGALVRLGRRRDALELLSFMLSDRRIPAWNQWPEISWRDPSSPSFIGDLPHSWISGEYILAGRTLFAYEQPSLRALVIAAGLSPDWLADGFVLTVENLPTYYGTISYSLRQESVDIMRLNIAGNVVAPGSIVVKPPVPGPIRRVEINGHALADFEEDGFICPECPADVLIRFDTAS
ncbi:MAG TPA: discoidin domain-containing protein [Thermodesulfobacteriota bacterium]|nr:discoidin domain-containing protein [Deltaproteobacteria bacterium]HNR11988.1 discoidin domain-containing protein [Thermodesulfobacteriota bacterium]HOC37838.1 discoidin domain-containing protein [Thermodesulfobacteriota bacterium]